MDGRGRFEILSVTVFGATLSIILFLKEHVDLHKLFGDYYPVAIVALGALSFDLFFKLAILAVKKVDFVKKLYWGELYFEGLWAYTSVGETRKYFGVWRIEQDAFRVHVIAFGLDDNYGRRSTVRSVSGLVGRDGVYETINERWDVGEVQRTYFSRSFFVPDRPSRHGLFRYPSVVRGETFIFGGSLDGTVARDLRLVRRDDCTCEEDLIAKLRAEMAADFVLHPA